MTDIKPFTVTEDGGRAVRLEKPLTGHNGAITSVRLRAPTFKDFIDLGDPTLLIVTQNGAAVPQDDYAVLKNYIIRLSNVDALIIEQGTLRDAMALIAAVKDFFQQASGRISTGSGIS